MTVNHVLEIEDLGQSIWMDNLNRDLIESGELKRMIEEQGIQGLTSNPAIFEKAIKGNAIYDADIEKGIKAGKSVLEIYESLIFDDIRQACDIFKPVYEQSQGLEARAAEGKYISKIASVASFFLSRIDSKIDEIIDAKLKNINNINVKAKLEVFKGKVAIANAKIAYQEYLKIIKSDRWQALAEKGAKVQRLLWASTSTKNPNYVDVMYVNELIGPDTVNTLPPSTLEACIDHCDVANGVTTNVDNAYHLIENLKDPDIEINLEQVMEDLLTDGIDKFVQPFNSLIASLQDKVERLATVAQ